MKTIILIGFLQIAALQVFAQDHDRRRGHDEHGHYNDHAYTRRSENHRPEVFRHNEGFRHYENRPIYHNDYAYHNNWGYRHNLGFAPAYRPGIHIGYPHAYIPLLSFSFGSAYPFGYAYQSDFDRVLIAIDNQNYDDGKLVVAKQALQDRSLTSNEVLTIMKSFSYDESRLQFAELAFDHVVDKQNYYTVNSAFAYDSSVQDLNNYLESQYGTH